MLVWPLGRKNVYTVSFCIKQFPHFGHTISPVTTPKCALIGGLDLKKVEHIANTRKLHHYVDLQHREENKLEVKMQKLQQTKSMSYEREIKELKEKYNINICLKGEIQEK